MTNPLLREFPGIKLKFAKEFAGYTDTDKKFREIARELSEKDDSLSSGEAKSSTSHRTYKPYEIRRIRQHLLGLFDDKHKDMPPIINLRMSKGGTGKTTLTQNIGTCLAQFGYKVLMIDGDPQASLSKQHGLDINKTRPIHIGHLLERFSKNEPTRVSDAIIPIYENGMLDLIAADISLAGINSWIMNVMNREHLFQRFLEKEADFFKQYEVIIIDSAPSTSLLTLNFMIASKIVTAAITPEGQSLMALEELESNIAEINHSYPDREPKLGMHIIVNRYRQSYLSHNEILENLASKYGPYLNNTIVREFVGFLRETNVDEPTLNAPVLENEPNSVGARDIIDVTKWLIKLYAVKLTAPGNKID